MANWCMNCWNLHQPILLESHLGLRQRTTAGLYTSISHRAEHEIFIPWQASKVTIPDHKQLTLLHHANMTNDKASTICCHSQKAPINPTHWEKPHLLREKTNSYWTLWSRPKRHILCTKCFFLKLGYLLSRNDIWFLTCDRHQ